jgi:CRP-like cAMP-binding protein
MSELDTVEFLGSVPLLAGQDESDLMELARVVRPRTVEAGKTLWCQGEDAREVLFIVDGAVATKLRVSGDGGVEIGSAGPGQILGEIGLLDGQGHTMDARAVETTTVLALGRLDFAALLAGQGAGAFRLRRALAELFAARLREQLRHLADTLGDGAGPRAKESVLANLEPSRVPDTKYVRRMATFHDFDSVALWGFLTSGKYVQCPKGQTLVAEGRQSPGCFLTINGAVEKVLMRGDKRIRVGLAGPGKAFGYEGLIDGDPSPVAAVARERALLLVLPGDVFSQLYNREDAIARVFLEAIQRDLLATLRQTLRPCARLAASV